MNLIKNFSQFINVDSVNEDANTNVPQVTFYLPQIKNTKGELMDDKKGRVKFTVAAAKLEGGGYTTDEFASVKTFSFGGTAAPQPVYSKKDDATKNINGSFVLTEEIYKQLVAQVNKPMLHGKTGVLTSVQLPAGNVELKETSYQVVYYQVPSQK